MKWVIFDIETDGLNPSKIHCLSYTDHEGKTGSLVGKSSLKDFFQSETYECYIGHDIIRYDIPVVERLLGITVNGFKVDTLALSWYLYPERPKAGLESWGATFGIPKPKIDDWENLDIEDYIHRCEEDVKINKQLWIQQSAFLRKLYPNSEQRKKFLRYLTFKMECLAEQSQQKWKWDIEFCENELQKLEKLKQEKFDILVEKMPKVPLVRVKTKPKILYKKDGTPSSAHLKWIYTLGTQGLPPDTESFQMVVGHEDGNPNSHVQLKDWLFSL